MIRVIAIFTGIGGFLGVALGAFAAHALKGQLSPYELSVWQTAVQYQLFHCAALLSVLAMLLRQPDNRCMRVAGVLFVLGITLFSGSLYGLALAGWRALGMVTPLGGMLLLLGWMMLSLGLVKLIASEQAVGK